MIIIMLIIMIMMIIIIIISAEQDSRSEPGLAEQVVRTLAVGKVGGRL